MLNDLQAQFNWEGRGSWKTKEGTVKSSFKRTELCELIKGIYVVFFNIILLPLKVTFTDTFTQNLFTMQLYLYLFYLCINYELFKFVIIYL